MKQYTAQVLECCESLDEDCFDALKDHHAEHADDEDWGHDADSGSKGFSKADLEIALQAFAGDEADLKTVTCRSDACYTIRTFVFQVMIKNIQPGPLRIFIDRHCERDEFDRVMNCNPYGCLTALKIRFARPASKQEIQRVLSIFRAERYHSSAGHIQVHFSRMDMLRAAYFSAAKERITDPDFWEQICLSMLDGDLWHKWRMEWRALEKDMPEVATAEAIDAAQAAFIVIFEEHMPEFNTDKDRISYVYNGDGNDSEQQQMSCAPCERPDIAAAVQSFMRNGTPNGACFNCGSNSHYQANCPKPRQKCRICHQAGHAPGKCPMSQSNRFKTIAPRQSSRRRDDRQSNGTRAVSFTKNNSSRYGSSGNRASSDRPVRNSGRKGEFERKQSRRSDVRSGTRKCARWVQDRRTGTWVRCAGNHATTECRRGQLTKPGTAERGLAMVELQPSASEYSSDCSMSEYSSYASSMDEPTDDMHEYELTESEDEFEALQQAMSQLTNAYVEPASEESEGPLHEIDAAITHSELGAVNFANDSKCSPIKANSFTSTIWKSQNNCAADPKPAPILRDTAITSLVLGMAMFIISSAVSNMTGTTSFETDSISSIQPSTGITGDFKKLAIWILFLLNPGSAAWAARLTQKISRQCNLQKRKMMHAETNPETDYKISKCRSMYSISKNTKYVIWTVVLSACITQCHADSQGTTPQPTISTLQQVSPPAIALLIMAAQLLPRQISNINRYSTLASSAANTAISATVMAAKLWVVNWIIQFFIKSTTAPFMQIEMTTCGPISNVISTTVLTACILPISHFISVHHSLQRIHRNTVYQDSGAMKLQFRIGNIMFALVLAAAAFACALANVCYWQHMKLSYHQAPLFTTAVRALALALTHFWYLPVHVTAVNTVLNFCYGKQIEVHNVFLPTTKYRNRRRVNKNAGRRHYDRVNMIADSKDETTMGLLRQVSNLQTPDPVKVSQSANISNAQGIAAAAKDAMSMAIKLITSSVCNSLGLSTPYPCSDQPQYSKAFIIVLDDEDSIFTMCTQHNLGKLLSLPGGNRQLEDNGNAWSTAVRCAADQLGVNNTTFIGSVRKLYAHSFSEEEGGIFVFFCRQSNLTAPSAMYPALSSFYTTQAILQQTATSENNAKRTDGSKVLMNASMQLIIFSDITFIAKMKQVFDNEIPDTCNNSPVITTIPGELGALTRKFAEANSKCIFVFDTTDEQAMTNTPSATGQGVVMGLENCYPIVTAFTQDEPFTHDFRAVCKPLIDNCIASIVAAVRRSIDKQHGQITVYFPGNGLGNSPGIMAESAPELYKYLQCEIVKLKECIKDMVKAYMATSGYGTPTLDASTTADEVPILSLARTKQTARVSTGPGPRKKKHKADNNKPGSSQDVNSDDGDTKDKGDKDSDDDDSGTEQPATKKGRRDSSCKVIHITGAGDSSSLSRPKVKSIMTNCNPIGILIAKEVIEGHRVLINCHAGQRRCAALAIPAMATLRETTNQLALTYINERATAQDNPETNECPTFFSRQSDEQSPWMQAVIPIENRQRSRGSDRPVHRISSPNLPYHITLAQKRGSVYGDNEVFNGDGVDGNDGMASLTIGNATYAIEQECMGKFDLIINLDEAAINRFQSTSNKCELERVCATIDDKGVELQGKSQNNGYSGMIAVVENTEGTPTPPFHPYGDETPYRYPANFTRSDEPMIIVYETNRATPYHVHCAVRYIGKNVTMMPIRTSGTDSTAVNAEVDYDIEDILEAWITELTDNGHRRACKLILPPKFYGNAFADRRNHDDLSTPEEQVLEDKLVELQKCAEIMAFTLPVEHIVKLIKDKTEDDSWVDLINAGEEERNRPNPKYKASMDGTAGSHSKNGAALMVVSSTAVSPATQINQQQEPVVYADHYRTREYAAMYRDKNSIDMKQEADNLVSKAVELFKELNMEETDKLTLRMVREEVQKHTMLNLKKERKWFKEHVFKPWCTTLEDSSSSQASPNSPNSPSYIETPAQEAAPTTKCPAEPAAYNVSLQGILDEAEVLNDNEYENSHEANEDNNSEASYDPEEACMSADAEMSSDAETEDEKPLLPALQRQVTVIVNDDADDIEKMQAWKLAFEKVQDTAEANLLEQQIILDPLSHGDMYEHEDMRQELDVFYNTGTLRTGYDEVSTEHKISDMVQINVKKCKVTPRHLLSRLCLHYSEVHRQLRVQSMVVHATSTMTQPWGWYDPMGIIFTKKGKRGLYNDSTTADFGKCAIIYETHLEVRRDRNNPAHSTRERAKMIQSSPTYIVHSSGECACKAQEPCTCSKRFVENLNCFGIPVKKSIVREWTEQHAKEVTEQLGNITSDIMTALDKYDAVLWPCVNIGSKIKDSKIKQLVHVMMVNLQDKIHAHFMKGIDKKSTIFHKAPTPGGKVTESGTITTREVRNQAVHDNVWLASVQLRHQVQADISHDINRRAKGFTKVAFGRTKMRDNPTYTPVPVHVQVVRNSIESNGVFISQLPITSKQLDDYPNISKTITMVDGIERTYAHEKSVEYVCGWPYVKSINIMSACHPNCHTFHRSETCTHKQNAFHEFLVDRQDTLDYKLNSKELECLSETTDACTTVAVHSDELHGQAATSLMRWMGDSIIISHQELSGPDSYRYATYDTPLNVQLTFDALRKKHAVCELDENFGSSTNYPGIKWSNTNVIATLIKWAQRCVPDSSKAYAERVRNVKHGRVSASIIDHQFVEMSKTHGCFTSPTHDDTAIKPLNESINRWATAMLLPLSHASQSLGRALNSAAASDKHIEYQCTDRLTVEWINYIATHNIAGTWGISSPSWHNTYRFNITHFQPLERKPAMGMCHVVPIITSECNIDFRIRFRASQDYIAPAQGTQHAESKLFMLDSKQWVCNEVRMNNIRRMNFNLPPLTIGKEDSWHRVPKLGKNVELLGENGWRTNLTKYVDINGVESMQVLEMVKKNARTLYLRVKRSIEKGDRNWKPFNAQTNTMCIRWDTHRASDLDTAIQHIITEECIATLKYKKIVLFIDTSNCNSTINLKQEDDNCIDEDTTMSQFRYVAHRTFAALSTHAMNTDNQTHPATPKAATAVPSAKPAEKGVTETNVSASSTTSATAATRTANGEYSINELMTGLQSSSNNAWTSFISMIEVDKHVSMNTTRLAAIKIIMRAYRKHKLRLGTRELSYRSKANATHSSTLTPIGKALKVTARAKYASGRTNESGYNAYDFIVQAASMRVHYHTANSEAAYCVDENNNMDKRIAARARADAFLLKLTRFANDWIAHIGKHRDTISYAEHTRYAEVETMLWTLQANIEDAEVTLTTLRAPHSSESSGAESFVNDDSDDDGWFRVTSKSNKCSNKALLAKLEAQANKQVDEQVPMHIQYMHMEEHAKENGGVDLQPTLQFGNAYSLSLLDYESESDVESVDNAPLPASTQSTNSKKASSASFTKGDWKAAEEHLDVAMSKKGSESYNNHAIIATRKHSNNAKHVPNNSSSSDECTSADEDQVTIEIGDLVFMRSAQHRSDATLPICIGPLHVVKIEGIQITGLDKLTGSITTSVRHNVLKTDSPPSKAEPKLFHFANPAAMERDDINLPSAMRCLHRAASAKVEWIESLYTHSSSTTIEPMHRMQGSQDSNEVIECINNITRHEVHTWGRLRHLILIETLVVANDSIQPGPMVLVDGVEDTCKFMTDAAAEGMLYSTATKWLHCDTHTSYRPSAIDRVGVNLTHPTAVTVHDDETGKYTVAAKMQDGKWDIHYNIVEPFAFRDMQRANKSWPPTGRIAAFTIPPFRKHDPNALNVFKNTCVTCDSDQDVLVTGSAAARNKTMSPSSNTHVGTKQRGFIRHAAGNGGEIYRDWMAFDHIYQTTTKAITQDTLVMISNASKCPRLQSVYTMRKWILPKVKEAATWYQTYVCRRDMSTHLALAQSYMQQVVIHDFKHSKRWLTLKHVPEWKSSSCNSTKVPTTQLTPAGTAALSMVAAIMCESTSTVDSMDGMTLRDFAESAAATIVPPQPTFNKIKFKQVFYETNVLDGILPYKGMRHIFQRGINVIPNAAKSLWARPKLFKSRSKFIHNKLAKDLSASPVRVDRICTALLHTTPSIEYEHRSKRLIAYARMNRRTEIGKAALAQHIKYMRTHNIPGPIRYSNGVPWNIETGPWNDSDFESDTDDDDESITSDPITDTDQSDDDPLHDWDDEDPSNTWTNWDSNWLDTALNGVQPTDSTIVDSGATQTLVSNASITWPSNGSWQSTALTGVQPVDVQSAYISYDSEDIIIQTSSPDTGQTRMAFPWYTDPPPAKRQQRKPQSDTHTPNTSQIRDSTVFEGSESYSNLQSNMRRVSGVLVLAIYVALTHTNVPARRSVETQNADAMYARSTAIACRQGNAFACASSCKNNADTGACAIINDKVPPDVGDTAWILLDTGATISISPHLSDFFEITSTKESKLAGFDQHTVTVSRRGSIMLRCLGDDGNLHRKIFHDVGYVPQASMRIVSISAEANSLTPCTFNFETMRMKCAQFSAPFVKVDRLYRLHAIIEHPGEISNVPTDCELGKVAIENGVSTGMPDDKSLKFTFTEYFGGLGTASRAWAARGHTPVSYFEKSSTLSSIYRAAFPACATFGTLASILASASMMAKFAYASSTATVAISGAPCQAFSRAGLMPGSKAACAHLYNEQTALVSACRPPVFITEQVPEVATIEKGRFQRKLTGDLRSLNYTTVSSILDSSNYGSAQCRRRLYTIAILPEVIAKCGPFFFDLPVVAHKASVIDIMDPPSQALRKLKVPFTYRRLPQSSVDHYSGPKPTHVTGNGSDKIGRYSYDITGPACTIKSSNPNNPGGNTQVYYDSRPGMNCHRQLSLLECARLQGLQHTMDLEGVDRQAGIAMLGNAMDAHTLLALETKLSNYLQPYLKARETGNMDTACPIEQAKHLTRKTPIGDRLKWPINIAHQRFNHCSSECLRRMGYKTGSFRCSTCMAKQRKANMSKKPVSEKTDRGDLFGMDIAGPFAESPVHHYKFVLGILDYHTKRTWCYPMCKKSESLECLKKCIVELRSEGVHPRVILSDNDSCFNSAEHEKYTADMGIHRIYSPAYNQSSNGGIESTWHRGKVWAAAAMLATPNRPDLSVPALIHVLYVGNYMPTKGNATHTAPNDVWYDKECNSDHIRSFGCKAYVWDPKHKGLEPRAKTGILLGFSANHSKGVYDILMDHSGLIWSSRSVKFDDALPIEFDAEAATTIDNHFGSRQDLWSASTNTTVPTVLRSGQFNDSTAQHIAARIPLIIGKTRAQALQTTVLTRSGKRRKYSERDLAYDTLEGHVIFTDPSKATAPDPKYTHGEATRNAAGVPPVMPTKSTATRKNKTVINNEKVTSSETANSKSKNSVLRMFILGTNLKNAKPYIQARVQLMVGKTESAIKGMKYINGNGDIKSYGKADFKWDLSHKYVDVIDAQQAEDAMYIMSDRVAMQASINYASLGVSTFVDIEFDDGEARTYMFVRGSGITDSVMTNTGLDPDNPTYKQAMASPSRLLWIKAIELEYQQIQDNGVWHLVSLPKGAKPLGTKLVLRRKFLASGDVDKLKARLVIQGQRMRKDIDYDETFAAVAQITTLRMLCAVAAERNLTLMCLDFDAAFTQSPIDKELFVKIPDGMSLTKDNQGNNQVLRLDKGLYGTKQGSRLWWNTISAWLFKYGFVSDIAGDPCLFKLEKQGQTMLLMLYTDDALMAFDIKTSEALYKNFLVDLAKDLKFTDRGALTWFLGYCIKQDITAGTVALDQKLFIKTMLEDNRMTEAYGKFTPSEPGKIPGENCQPKETPEGLKEQAEMKHRPFRNRVGSLLWLYRGTKPIIGYIVGMLTRVLHNPGFTHWDATSWVLRYIKNTADEPITYHRTQGGATLVGYVDSDYLPNYGDEYDNRKSTTGWCFFIGDAVVSWKSARQECVAASTCEAEYMGAWSAVKELVYLRKLLKFMGAPQTGPTSLYEDNQACIRISENPCDGERVKHIDAKYHLVRQNVMNKIVKLHYCSTENMVADAFTKALAGPKIKKFNAFMMGADKPPHANGKDIEDAGKPKLK